MNIKLLAALGGLLAVVTPTARALELVVIEPTRTFLVGQDLGDVADPAATFVGTVSDSAILSLMRVEVGLVLAGTTAGGGSASDMFVTLTKTSLGGLLDDGDPTSVLLNRVGVTADDPFGYHHDGWDVTFNDYGADGDVHFADTLDGQGVLSGVFEPDGRSLPGDTSRSYLLDVFLGAAGNGDWRLNVADFLPGGEMSLVSWSLTLTGTVLVDDPFLEVGVDGLPEFFSEVPEASTWVVGGAMMLWATAAWRRARR